MLRRGQRSRTRPVDEWSIGTNRYCRMCAPVCTSFINHLRSAVVSGLAKLTPICFTIAGMRDQSKPYGMAARLSVSLAGILLSVVIVGIFATDARQRYVQAIEAAKQDTLNYA